MAAVYKAPCPYPGELMYVIVINNGDYAVHAELVFSEDIDNACLPVIQYLVPVNAYFIFGDIVIGPDNAIAWMINSRYLNIDGK